MAHTTHVQAHIQAGPAAQTQDTRERSIRGYEKPAFEVISLDCEISSYAPDGDDRPLFSSADRA